MKKPGHSTARVLKPIRQLSSASDGKADPVFANAALRVRACRCALQTLEHRMGSQKCKSTFGRCGPIGPHDAPENRTQKWVPVLREKMRKTKILEHRT